MNEDAGKHFFKLSSIVMGLIYLALAIILLYCLGVVCLPTVVIWVVGTVKTTIEFLSFGDPNLLMFNYAFFISCTSVLVVTGVTIKIICFIKARKVVVNDNSIAE